MTSIAFLIVFSILAIACLFYLPLGILSWLWITLQSPQQLVVTTVPVNLIVALACLVAVLFSNRHFKLPVNTLTIIMVLMLGHATVTTMMSVFPASSWLLYDRFWKTMVLVLFICSFMATRTRLHAIAAVIVVSLGMLAVKAGVFTFVTGGANRIWGPDNSQIGYNNHFGGALVMALPFAIYMAVQSKERIVKLGFRFIAFMILIAALFTYSRGTLLSLVGVLGAYWLISSYKAPIAIAAIAAILVALPLMPTGWIERMSSIETSGSRDTADESVQGRFDSWEAHWRMAQRRPFVGGGFRTIEQPSIWATLHEAPKARAAHNSYFQVLGEHGFPGLFLFLSLLSIGLLTAFRIRRAARFDPAHRWAHDLATACMLALIAYSVSSLTLSKATYDLFYIVLAVIACLKRVLDDERRETRKWLTSSS